MATITNNFLKAAYPALLASHIGCLKEQNIYHGYEAEEYKRITYTLGSYKTVWENICLSKTGRDLYQQYIGAGGICPTLILEALEANACVEKEYAYLDLDKDLYAGIYLTLYSFKQLVENLSPLQETPQYLLRGLQEILEDSIGIIKKQPSYSVCD